MMDVFIKQKGHMNFIQWMLFILLTYCPLGFSSICVNTSVNTALNADVSFQGHSLAFSDSHFKDFKIFSANNNADFANKVEQMAIKGCSIIVGLSTTQECLIAGSILKKHGLIGLSPCCGYDELKTFYPFIYIGTAPLSKEVGFIIKNLKKKKFFGKIYAVYQPTNIYSNAMFMQFKKQYKNPFTEIRVSADDVFDITQFKSIKNQPSTILVFTYPLPSVKLLLKLSNLRLISEKTKIIGGSSWGDEISLFRSIKSTLKQAGEVDCVEMLDWNKIKGSSVFEKFIKQYGREPVDIEILNYDITKLAIKCHESIIGKTKGKIEAFKQCMINKKYNGESGDFIFNHNSPFAERPIYLINLLNRI